MERNTHVGIYDIINCTYQTRYLDRRTPIYTSFNPMNGFKKCMEHVIPGIISILVMELREHYTKLIQNYPSMDTNDLQRIYDYETRIDISYYITNDLPGHREKTILISRESLLSMTLYKNILEITDEDISTYKNKDMNTLLKKSDWKYLEKSMIFIGLL